MIFSKNTAIYIQLFDTLKLKILSCEYETSANFPSVRTIAKEFSVNPNTAQRALALLEAEGLLRTKRNEGRYVTDDISLISSLRAAYANQIASDFIVTMQNLGYEKADLSKFY